MLPMLALVARAADRSLEAEVERYLEVTGAGSPLAHVDSGALRFADPGGSFAIHIRGRMLLDSGWQRSPDFDSENGAFSRQIRLGMDGHIYRNAVWAVEIQIESDGTVALRDAFVGVRELGGFGTFQAGHQRRPFSLDGMTSLLHHTFMERAAPTRAFQLGRDSGVRLHNSHFDDRLSWTAGAFRLTDSSGSASGDGGYSFAARVSGLVWRSASRDRRLHFGASLDWESPEDDTEQFRTRPGPNEGDYFLDTGQFAAEREHRVSFAAALLVNAFAIHAEFFGVRTEADGTRSTFSGWYVQASYWITGEVQAFNDAAQIPGRMVPRRNFHAGGGGAGGWRVALRYDFTDLSDGAIDGGEMDSLTFGLTWQWNPHALAKFNVVYADVKSGPLGAGDLYYVLVRFQYDF